MIISKSNIVKDNKIDFPMTRERYLSTWKVFRSISDENHITATHILSLDSWENINSILDLGCGDGLITKSIVLNSSAQIDKVMLLDPDKEMLEEASLNLTELGVVPEVERRVSKFEDYLTNHSITVDVILAIHLVYLITPESFRLLIENLPVGKKLILVLDDEGSVFTQLWEQTAPKYVERSRYVRQYLTELHGQCSINKTTITSKIINPLIQRTDIKDALLSILSYSDFSLMDTACKNFVEACVAENVSGRFLQCTSACYEIMKIK